MTIETKEVMVKIKKDLTKKLKGITVILFGSVARGDDTEGSDIDLCIICQKKQRNTISNILMRIENESNRNIQVIFTDKDFSDLDHTFIETILREGTPLVGEMPAIPMERIKLDPYRLIRYEIKKLTNSEKMKIRRLLYGIVTKKRYKKKVYTNKQVGILDASGGIRTGIASIIVPEKEAKKIVKLLREHGAVVQSFPVWMSQV